MRRVIVITSIALVCVGIWAFFPHEKAATAEEEKDNPAYNREEKIVRRNSGELMKQRIQLAGLQRQVSDLKRQDDPPMDNDEPNDDEDIDPEIREEQEMAKALSERKELVAKLDDILMKNPGDDEWFNEIQEKARLWSEEEQRADLISLECGDKLCRAEVVPKDNADRYSVMDEATMKPPFNTSGFVYTENPEGGATMIYFTKEGYSMRDMNPLE